MKPVVSSLVALALAIVPAYAMAADKDKPAVTHPHKKPAASHHKKPNKGLDPVAHKGEPKGDKATIVPASMTTKPSKADKKDLPKLPAPSAHKAQKAGTEKAAPRKPSKKSDSSDKDGQPTRDEETAELVARIKGNGLEKVTHKGEDLEDTRCRKTPVEIIRGPEADTFSLMKCDGKVAPTALDHLSILVRPGNADRPTTPLEELAKKKGSELAKGIKRVDPGLPMRLQAIADHFTKKGQTAKFSIVSGYRPASVGSMHQSGRAVDFRLEGVKNEEVVAFCKTLVDTGCGFYPNSSFVHIDVREPGSGHTSWIDASGPGETPRYVHQWPPPAEEKADDEKSKDDELEKTSLEKKSEPQEESKSDEPASDDAAN